MSDPIQAPASSTVIAPRAGGSLLGQYLALCKPRVLHLIVFCAFIGMVLAVPGVPTLNDALRMLFASAGIWLVAAAAAAFNCLVEKSIDAKMRRTAWRPTARGELSDVQALLFSGVLCGLGSWLLYVLINPLTMWLTFATFIGYAVVYTVILKPLTPQNIVIGGASGAMPPVLGWAAMTGEVTAEALILFLIIFLWTPPHFWALALWKKINADYTNAGVPMLPVVAGADETRRQILLYTLVLVPLTLSPALTGTVGWFYTLANIGLGAMFLWHAVQVYRQREGEKAEAALKALFKFSTLWLFIVFALILLERALGLPLYAPVLG